MHGHNPDQVRCRAPQCREFAVGYCGDEVFELDSSPLCATHLMEHQRRGHDVRFVDVGYRNEETATRQAEEERERAQAETRAAQEARWAEANRRREEEARRAKERADRERKANEARRREEHRRAAEEARHRAEEARRTAEQRSTRRAAGRGRTQSNDRNATGSNVPCPTCEGVGRVPTKSHNILGLPVDPSPEEIGTAFRRKALQYHPDRNKAPDASERMKEVNEARRLLAGSAEIRAGQECPQCHGRRTVWRSSAEERRRAEEERLAEERQRAEEERLAEERRRAEEERLAEERRQAEEERERERAEEEARQRAEQDEEVQAAAWTESQQQAEQLAQTEEERIAEEDGSCEGGGRGVTTAVDPAPGSSGGHGCCWVVLLLLLIVAGVGGYYWYTQYGLPIEIEFLSTPTPAPQAAQERVPTPTPASSPAPPTPTSYPCADPVAMPPTSTPTPTAAPIPAATSTPSWPPTPLSDAWREWSSGWNRQEVDAALAESLAVFDAGLDELEGMPLAEACRLVAEFEKRMEMAEHLVREHRLQREAVPGQASALSWTIWLRHQRGLFAEAVLNHAPVAECRSILAPPTLTATPTPAPPTATPPPGPPTSTPLPLCPTATPTPTATATATATPRPTATVTPVPRPTATSISQMDKQRLGASEIQELRLLALELVNKDRADHSLQPVTLGSNPAAQLHAEDMLEHNYSGHWWVDGRDPTQVYSETGGTSYAQENTADWGCVSLTNCRLAPPRDAIVRLQQSLMGSPGHRRNILKPEHRTLNIGIAYDGKRYTLAQLFGGGAVEADDRPSLSPNGAFALSLSKRESGVRVHRTIDIYYTPPNAPLTPSQIEFLNSGACIGGVGFIETCGERVAGIIPPAPSGSSYSNLGAIYVEADRWDENTQSFRFTASLGSRATKPGVYTVVVFRANSALLIKLSVTQPAR